MEKESRAFSFDAFHLRLIYLGLLLNIVLPLILLGLGYFFRSSAFVEQQNFDLRFVLVILLAVSFAELGVIWILKRKWLGNFLQVPALPAVQTVIQPPARSPQKFAFSFAIVIYSLCLTPSIYGFVYFLLGGNLNWFVLFIAITFLGFLLFKPKEEELKKFFDKESVLALKT